MPEQDPRKAFGLALKNALEGPIMRSAGTTALTVALFREKREKGERKRGQCGMALS